MGVNKGTLLGCMGVAIAPVAIFGLILLWMDTSIVHDPHRQVRTAYFEYGNGERDYLTKLPWGTWVGHVGGDGSLQIECTDGNRPVGTYVTGFMATEATVNQKCEVEYAL